jgi:Ca2+-binding RTX toxin-like protein
MRGRPTRLLLVPVLVACASGIASAADNAVSGGRVDRVTAPVTANALKPAACAGIPLSQVVVGSGVFGGTAAAELILGGAGADTIVAGDGDDCVVGGGGIDTITGGIGTDVCIGGAGLDVFLTCETQVQ